MYNRPYYCMQRYVIYSKIFYFFRCSAKIRVVARTYHQCKTFAVDEINRNTVKQMALFWLEKKQLLAEKNNNITSDANTFYQVVRIRIRMHSQNGSKFLAHSIRFYPLPNHAVLAIFFPLHSHTYCTDPKRDPFQMLSHCCMSHCDRTLWGKGQLSLPSLRGR